ASRPGGARPTPAPRVGGPRSGSGSRPAPRSGTGRPAPRPTGTGRRPANPRLLRQRLFVFVVVTLLVALGIAVAQGCQGPARGLGGDDGARRSRSGTASTPPDVTRSPQPRTSAVAFTPEA
ncbi:serine/threonine protein kinase, partial [Streptomyces collinus]